MQVEAQVGDWPKAEVEEGEKLRSTRQASQFEIYF